MRVKENKYFKPDEVKYLKKTLNITKVGGRTQTLTFLFILNNLFIWNVEYFYLFYNYGKNKKNMIKIYD
mgnify:CR=1 FL=1|jgi:hypothetical protein|tara:strand:+ start:8191 stop:8397 length:207 start_codon:yes stop_codon:yes gene_type:complete